MATKTKKITSNSIISAILLIIIGVLLIIFKSGTLNIALTVIGALFIVYGIYDIIYKRIVEGIIKVVVGIVIIVCGWTILAYTLLILGIVMVAYGIITLFTDAKKWKKLKGINKLFAILKPIFIIVLGILLIVGKWVTADIFFIIIGIVAIISGVLQLTSKS